MLLEFANTSAPVADNEHASIALRHPKLGKPYLAEFMPIYDEVGRCFLRQFPYDTFFLAEHDVEPELRQYLGLLIERAQGRPVLQFCRSTGRLDWLRKNFTSRHLYLWRHPWDQWWSYKVASYFDTVNLLILNARNVPPVFQEIRDILSFQPYHDTTIEKEFSHFDSHGLDDEGSYFLFFALWYHAMYEGLRTADLVISIDALSHSAKYRSDTLGHLEAIGVGGLDFSNCHIPQACFLDSDVTFFSRIEERVCRLFDAHGYSGSGATCIAELRQNTTREEYPEPKNDLKRLREMVRYNISETAQYKRLIWNQRMEIERLTCLEAELLSIYNSWLWKILLPFLRAYKGIRVIYRNLKSNGRDSKLSG